MAAHTVPDRDNSWGTWAAENGGRSGTGYREGIWHALGEPYPTLGSARDPQPAAAGGPAGTAARWTLCGLVADVVRKAGVFNPDRHNTCPACGWWEAVRVDTIPQAVARLAATPGRAPAVALAEAILADAAAPAQHGVDHPGTVELLAAVTAHAGDALISEACVEGECDHPDQDDGGCPTAAVACRACSVLAGSWAGEWEGGYRPEATVITPCSVLAALAEHYQIGAGLFDHAQLSDTLATAGGAS